MCSGTKTQIFGILLLYTKHLVDEDRVNKVSVRQSLPESVAAEICFNFMSHLNVHLCHLADVVIQSDL